jgi:flagellar assembly factor FliW
MSDALTFVEPPPGLAPLTAFDLAPIEQAEGLFAMHSVDAPDIRLFVIDAPAYLPDYAPRSAPSSSTRSARTRRRMCACWW